MDAREARVARWRGAKIEIYICILYYMFSSFQLYGFVFTFVLFCLTHLIRFYVRIVLAHLVRISICFMF